jgi:RHS repeat-associated protein
VHTRQLADASGAVNTEDSYSYDAYGVMLGGNPTATSPAATNGLYTGEQFDEHAQHYYLRARYYNPLNGRFNRMDPYAGSPQDPQSLHKYLYCHANPVNGVDPSGKWHYFVVVLVICVAIMAALLLTRTDSTESQEGLGNPFITNQDIVDAINGHRGAAEVLERIIEPLEQCPTTWPEVYARLEAEGVAQAGERWVGVVGYGRTLSPGRQLIIKYFESIQWNHDHPNARHHPSWMLGGTHPYLSSKAEVQRMNIIVSVLIDEAQRRRIPGY